VREGAALQGLACYCVNVRLCSLQWVRHSRQRSASAVQDGTAASDNRLAVALPIVATSLHLRLVLRRVYRWRLWRRLLRLRRRRGRREERRLLLRCRLRRPRLRLAIACGTANRSRRLVRLAGCIAVGRHRHHTAC